MVTINELSERQKDILRSVVHCFIQSATPVGSKHLAEHFFVDLSPATIRNVLAELEQQGYIDQPYTSAGRVPTDLGYRAYVDNLMKPSALTLVERQALEIQTSGGIEAEVAPRRAHGLHVLDSASGNCHSNMDMRSHVPAPS